MIVHANEEAKHLVTGPPLPTKIRVPMILHAETGMDSLARKTNYSI